MKHVNTTEYDAIYAGILDAAAHPESRTCCVHMWESYDVPKELEQKLRVMSGRQDGVYYTNYRQQFAQPEHGMVALATSAIAPDVKAKLFTALSDAPHCGLLLLDAPPIVASNKDLSSRYFAITQNRETDAAAQLSINTNIKHQDPEYAPKNVALFSDLMEMQGLQASVGTVELPPLDVSLSKPAQKAYAHMMKALPQMDEDFGNNEVCVNATLDHLAAILLYDQKDRPLPRSTKEWQTALQEDAVLAEHLAAALSQRDQAQAVVDRWGKGQPLTVTIYQHNGAERFVHFPPTLKNRTMVRDAVRMHAVAENKGVA